MRITRGRTAIDFDYTVGPASAAVLLRIVSRSQQPMNIREVMTPNPQCVSPSDSIQNAARIMRDCDTGAVPVVDNGRPVGILTDRDIVVRAVADGGQLNRPVREIVSGNVVCASPEMST